MSSFRSRAMDTGYRLYTHSSVAIWPSVRHAFALVSAGFGSLLSGQRFAGPRMSARLSLPDVEDFAACHVVVDDPVGRVHPACRTAA